MSHATRQRQSASYLTLRAELRRTRAAARRTWPARKSTAREFTTQQSAAAPPLRPVRLASHVSIGSRRIILCRPKVPVEPVQLGSCHVAHRLLHYLLHREKRPLEHRPADDVSQRGVADHANDRAPVVRSQPNEPRHNLQRPHWLALQHLKRHNAKALGRVHGAPVCKLLVVQAACHNTARNQRVEQSDSTTNSVEPHRSHISALLALTSLCSHSSIARIEASTACSNGSGTFEMT